MTPLELNYPPHLPPKTDYRIGVVGAGFIVLLTLALVDACYQLVAEHRAIRVDSGGETAGEEEA